MLRSDSLQHAPTPPASYPPTQISKEDSVTFFVDRNGRLRRISPIFNAKVASDRAPAEGHVTFFADVNNQMLKAMHQISGQARPLSIRGIPTMFSSKKEKNELLKTVRSSKVLLKNGTVEVSKKTPQNVHHDHYSEPDANIFHLPSERAIVLKGVINDSHIRSVAKILIYSSITIVEINGSSDAFNKTSADSWLSYLCKSIGKSQLTHLILNVPDIYLEDAAHAFPLLLQSNLSILHCKNDFKLKSFDEQEAIEEKIRKEKNNAYTLSKKQHSLQQSNAKLEEKRTYTGYEVNRQLEIEQTGGAWWGGHTKEENEKNNKKVKRKAREEILKLNNTIEQIAGAIQSNNREIGDLQQSFDQAWSRIRNNEARLKQYTIKGDESVKNFINSFSKHLPESQLTKLITPLNFIKGQYKHIIADAIVESKLTKLDIRIQFNENDQKRLNDTLNLNLKKKCDLFNAIPNTATELVEQLFLKCPALVTNDNGDTALHLAAHHGRLDLVKLFLNRCPIQTLNRNRKTPQDLAREADFQNIVDILTEKPSPPLDNNDSSDESGDEMVYIPFVKQNEKLRPQHNDSSDESGDEMVYIPFVKQNEKLRPQHSEINIEPQLQPSQLEDHLKTVLSLLKVKEEEFDGKLVERDRQLDQRFEQIKQELNQALSVTWEHANHLNVSSEQLNHIAEQAVIGLKTVKAQLLDYETKLQALEQQAPSGSTEEDITRIKEEVALLTDDYNRRTYLPKRLEELFELDEEDPRRSLRNFYCRTLNKLTAFAVGVQALRSGIVEHVPGWKDSVASGIFGLLGIAVDVAGGAVSGAWGAGALIPIIGKPLLLGSELLWETYRGEKKQNEIKKAATYFTGGLEAIDRQNQYLAYGLTYLLQMQLPHCQPEGANRIVDDWLYNLCYNVMKMEGGNEDEANGVARALIRIGKANEKKHRIKTYGGDRKWNTKSIFEEAGVSFSFENEMHYHSCRMYEQRRRSSTTQIKDVTRADKYGYLSFPSHEEAMIYEKGTTERLQQKYPAQSIKWMRDAYCLANLSNSKSSSTQLLTVMNEFEKYKIIAEDRREADQIRISVKDKEFQDLSSEVEKLKRQCQEQQETIKKMQQALARALQHLGIDSQQ